ncbi:FAD:protein FMN transferase [Marivita sp. GX14005]|uniref:FAD:protein FMN transferase n=1 Tax=Marivita sp. GX14005 TaxID=2942276 RepID=UPI0032D59CA2
MTTRRRFLAISAAAFAVPGIARAEPVYTWQGVALGARATLRLAHPDAKAIAERVASEISRLEDIFSLYRAESALSRLNRDAALENPPFELLECLSLAGAVHNASSGRFDVTVQPLWAAYAEAGARGSLPAAGEIEVATAKTGWSKVSLAPSAITLEQGMALTLNGIAQGYIADRVAQMLEKEGLTDILIDTGEFRAIGGHPGGGAWPVKLAAGGSVRLATRALATSAPLGTSFDAGGQVGHILDPRTGKPGTSKWREISVTARSAALADALSTAACLMSSPDEIGACIARFDGARLEKLTEA